VQLPADRWSDNLPELLDSVDGRLAEAFAPESLDATPDAKADPVEVTGWINATVRALGQDKSMTRDVIDDVRGQDMPVSDTCSLT
jgi:hypothetical protein